MVLELLSGQTEDVLKKENPDHLIPLVKDLLRFDIQAMKIMQFVLKYLQSSSVVVKLTGWDLLQVLIDEAMKNRPFGESYEVTGAGEMRLIRFDCCVDYHVLRYTYFTIL